MTDMISCEEMKCNCKKKICVMTALSPELPVFLCKTDDTP
jgi:hypothetical protein